jgi:regulator of sigma E protease
MNVLFAILGFAITIGVLVTWHELGHYLAALACKTKVTRFSLGFGRTLFSRRYGKDQTEFVLGAIPLGGYVAMVRSTDEGLAATDLPRAFDRRPIWQRAIIIAAGPFANFVLAFILITGLYMVGVPEQKAMLSAPTVNTVAANIGIAQGELVLEVNDKPVQSYANMMSELLAAVVSSDSAKLLVQAPNGERATRLLPLQSTKGKEIGESTFRCLGVQMFRPPVPALIGMVQPNGPAAKAGLMVDDRIVSANNRAIEHFDQLVAIVRTSPAQPVSLTLERKGQQLSVNVTPDAVKDCDTQVGRLGVGAQPLKDIAWIDQLQTTRSYGMTEAMAVAINKIKSMFQVTVQLIYKMLIGEASPKNLSGPLTMADYAGQATRAGGMSLIDFLASVSIAIGIFNLLPLPVLDGGQLVMLGVEAARGRPVSDRVQEVIMRIGVACVLALTLFALINDFTRYLPLRS